MTKAMIAADIEYAPGTAKRVIVGAAGHIDHGKTQLVYALTGIDTDRLPEEKRRGITIDLGFAMLEMQDAQGRQVKLSIIDVPGHHAFIRNMLAGTGGIDCVLLAIAADEGVKAQTEEHLAICALLGIERGVIALTKSDLASPGQIERTRQSVARFLAGTFLENAPIVPVSSVTGAGLDALKQALAVIAAKVPPRSTESVLRLPIDRAFSMRGFGTVVTGTLQAGQICAGDKIEQHSGGRVLRVRGVQVHGETCGSAKAPCRVALNLAGVEAAEIGRGDMLAPPGTLMPIETVEVELTMLPNAPPLRHSSRVRVHAFTSDAQARILFFNRKSTRDPGSGLARLQLGKPLLLIPGDRFVLRQLSPAATVGGGRVLDAYGPRSAHKAGALEFLSRLQCANDTERLRLRVERRGAEGVTMRDLVAETGWTPEALRRRAAPLLASGALHECQPGNEGGRDAAGARWVAADAVDAMVEKAAAAEGSESTTVGSLSRAGLRSRLRLNAPVFDLVLKRLLDAGKYELDGDTLRKAGGGDPIPEPQRKQLDAIEAIYAKAGLAAPLMSDVAKQLGIAPAAMREPLTLLLRAHRLVRMGANDAFVHPRALEQLYAKLRRRRGESFDVGGFKTLTGLTRKHAIPLLEHLDQVRVTRNNGGTRVVL